MLSRLIPSSAKSHLKNKLGVPSLKQGLVHLQRLGYRPRSAVDVGAYQGEWTRTFLSVFPGTPVMMVEPQLSKEKWLQSVCAEHRTVQYEMALLGPAEGALFHFSEDETASHVQRELDGDAPQKAARSLDALLQSRSFPAPDFLKLDVQGFELDVLRGGKQALAVTDFCLLEVALLDYGQGNPLMLEVVNFMDTAGFQAYDILSIMRRPYDNALDQLDLLFIKKDHRLIAEKRWK